MPKVGGRVFERVITNGRTQFKPVAGARVVFLEVGNLSNQAWADTDSNGAYSFELAAGNYDTVAGAAGYTLHSTLGQSGHSVLRNTGRAHTNNFFLDREVAEEPDVFVQTQASIDAIIYLPEQGDGRTAVERDLPTTVSFNVTKGTMDVADIPSFRNEDGTAFAATIRSDLGTFTKANGEANLKVHAIINPDAPILGRDIELSNVALSTQTTIAPYEGRALSAREKRMVLVGKARTHQPGRPAIYDDKPMIVKLVITLDDVQGLV